MSAFIGKYIFIALIIFSIVSCSDNSKKKSTIPKNIKDYIAIAEKTGDSKQEFYIGNLYLKGKEGAVKDDVKARAWFSKAAKKGNAAAMCSLGRMYFNGCGGEKNIAKAISLYKKASTKGSAQAATNLGCIYLYGKLVKKDYKKAREWFLKAAKKGNVAAMCNLGWMYFNGHGGEKNITEAISLYKKASTKGNAQAASNLGYIYLNGKVLKKDHKKAKMWFSKASDKGNLDAMRMLGWMNTTGKGGKKNIANGIKLYEAALAKGNKRVLFNLGNEYIVKKDYKKAREYYRKGATLGDSNCMNVLGTMNLWGIGASANYAKAREWYQKAANKKNPLAMMWLGAIYDSGYGVSKDIKMAEQWYKKGVALNSPPAINRLAMLWADNGKVDDAEQLINRAIKIHPSGFQSTYGYIHYKKGEYDTALKILKKTVKKHSKNPISKMYLGDVYFKLGKIKEAKKHWQEALELFEEEEFNPKFQRFIKEITVKLEKI